MTQPDNEAYAASDGANDRKYFIITPQLVWAKCDNPYEYMLWNVVKMIAAEYGECYVTTPNLARLCMMSTGSVSNARTSLLEKGLIIGQKVARRGGMAWHLKIPDMWAANVKWRSENKSLTGRMELKPPRTKAQKEGEEDSQIHEVAGKSSPGERKENPSRRTEKPSPALPGMDLSSVPKRKRKLSPLAMTTEADLAFIEPYNRDRAAKGYSLMTKYQSVQQMDEVRSAAEVLGCAKVAAVSAQGLRTGITKIGSLVAYIAATARKHQAEKPETTTRNGKEYNVIRID